MSGPNRQRRQAGKRRGAEEDPVDEEEWKDEINSKILKMEEEVKRQRTELTDNQDKMNDANKNIEGVTKNIQTLMERFKAIEDKISGYEDRSSSQGDGQDGTERTYVLKKEDLESKKTGIRE